jgi:2-oxoglutarate ferredoxin oxidoreductase subunit delta
VSEQVESKPAAPAQEKKKVFEINVYKAWCKGCGICIEFCPKQVLEATPTGRAKPTHPDCCIGCMQCVLRCPDFAITVEEKVKAAKPPRAGGKKQN